MNDIINVMNKTMDSREFKNLHKCSQKHCADYEKLLVKEKQVIKEIDMIHKKTKSVKSFSEMIPLFANLYDKMAELLTLKQDKKAHLCIIEKCSKEYVDKIAAESNNMADIYKKQKKDTINTLSRLKKVEEKMKKKAKDKK